MRFFIRQNKFSPKIEHAKKCYFKTKKDKLKENYC